MVVLPKILRHTIRPKASGDKEGGRSPRYRRYVVAFGSSPLQACLGAGTPLKVDDFAGAAHRSDAGAVSEGRHGDGTNLLRMMSPFNRAADDMRRTPPSRE